MAKDRPNKRRRWLYLGGALLLLVAASVFLYMYFLSSYALRSTIQKLAEREAGVVTSVEDAEFQWGRGVVLRGLVVEDPTDAVTTPILEVKDAVLTPDWSGLWRGRLALDTLRIDGISADIHFDRERRWPLLERILARERKPSEGKLPRIVIHDAAIKLSPADADGPIPPLELKEIEFVGEPIANGQGLDISLQFSKESMGSWEAVAQVFPKQQSVEGTVAVQGLEIGPHFRPFLPIAYRKAWDEMDPAGMTDAQLDFIWHAADTEPLQLAGTAEIRAGVAQHPLLPLPLTGITISARLDRKSLEFSKVSAKFGDALLSGKGNVAISPTGKTIFKADAKLAGLVLEPVLITTLPPDAQEWWTRLKPEGRLAAELSIESTEAAGLDYSGRLDLQGVSVKPDMIEWGVSNLSGSLYVSPESISTRGPITGDVAGGRLETMVAYDPASRSLSGISQLIGAEVSVLAAEALPREWAAHVPADVYRDWVKDVQVAATLNSRVSFSTSPGADVEYQAYVDVTRAHVAHPRIHEPVIISGNLTITPKELMIGAAAVEWLGATAKLEPSTFSLKPGKPWEVSFTISDLALTPSLRDFIPEQGRKFWDMFKDPTGILDVKALVHKSGEPGSPVGSDVMVTVHDGASAYVHFPYPLTQVKGFCEVIDGQLTDVFVNGVNDTGDVDIAIQGVTYEGNPAFRYVIRGRHVPVAPDLYAAFPEFIQGLYKPEDMTGVFDLDLVLHFVHANEEDPRHTHVEGLLNIDELHLSGDRNGDVRNGRIAIEDGTVSDGSVSIAGSARINELTAENVDLQNVWLTLRSQEHLIDITHFVAECYGGNVSGTLRVEPPDAWEKSRHFNGSLNLMNARVEQITGDQEVKGITGDLSATTTFNGNTARIEDFHAFGAMTIRNANIGELPGILSPLNLVVFKKLKEPAFNAMELSYVIEGEKLIANEINFVGSVLSLYGKGTINNRGELDFNFVPEFGPQTGLRIPVLDDVIKFIKSNTIPIAVAGAYNDPVLRLNPILSLTRAVQRMFFRSIPFEAPAAEGEKS